jgi:Protein of unknown function (DUF3309)
VNRQTYANSTTISIIIVIIESLHSSVLRVRMFKGTIRGPFLSIGSDVLGDKAGRTLAVGESNVACNQQLLHPRFTVMNLLVLVLVLLLVVGALPTWPYSGDWGYYPSSGLGLLLLIVIIVALSRRRVV